MANPKPVDEIRIGHVKATFGATDRRPPQVQRHLLAALQRGRSMEEYAQLRAQRFVGACESGRLRRASFFSFPDLDESPRSLLTVWADRSNSSDRRRRRTKHGAGTARRGGAAGLHAGHAGDGSRGGDATLPAHGRLQAKLSCPTGISSGQPTNEEKDTTPFIAHSLAFPQGFLRGV